MHASTPAAGAPAGRTSTFSALRHRNYRFFWAGQAMFVAAQNMEHVGLGWLVYDLTGSALSLGLTGLAQAGPRIALSLIGGAVADRVDRQRLVVGLQGTAAALYFVLATLIAVGWIQVWHAMVIAFLLGCVRAFDGPSRQSMVPYLVTKEEIPSAVALGNLAWEVPRTVGPATAGVLIALVGVGTTFYVAAAGLVSATILFGLIRVTMPPPRSSGQNLLRNVLDGLVFIRHHEVFLALIGLVFFNSVFGMSYQILLPAFARDILEVGSEGLGFLQSANAVGAILGSLAAAYLSLANRRGWQVLAGAFVFGCVIVGLALSTWFPLSLGLMFVIGMSSALYMITINTVIQVKVPDEYRGRVSSVWGLTYSLAPLGGMVSGTLAEFAGASFAVALGGGLVVLMAVFVAITVRQVRELA